MKQGMNLAELAATVVDRSESKRDYVVGVKAMDFGITESGDIEFYAGVKGHGGIGGIMSEHATRQMTAELDIPARFVQTIKEEDPSYLPTLMNRRAHTKDESQRMLRTIHGNRCIAAVSPSFSRDYDNDIILRAILPVLQESGLQVASCNVSDTMMYIKVLSERQAAINVGDIVQAGISVKNSDVGLSRAAITELLYRLICTNGMARPKSVDAYGRIHRGSRLPEGFIPSVETTSAHQQAIASEMRDMTRYLLSEERFNETLTQIEDAKEKRLETKNLDVAVKELGKTVGFNQTEGDDILAYLIEGGDFSQWGVVNAVTRYSQDVNDYDRASEFETLGGKILELHPRQWNTIITAQEAA